MAFLSANLGNSRVSFCLFEGEVLTRRGSLPAASDPGPFLRSWASGARVERVGLCSVNPPREGDLERCLHSLGAPEVRRVGRDAPVGIPNRCSRPERVGMDRLVAARAAWERVRGPCLVLDFGTAVTLGVVNRGGEFLGGAIAPGFGLCAKALRGGTALLPEVDLFGEPSSIVGRETEEAIAAGIQFGLQGLAEKWIELGRRELGSDAAVLATGGDLERVRGLTSIQKFLPDLVHEGIFLVCK